MGGILVYNLSEPFAGNAACNYLHNGRAFTSSRNPMINAMYTLMKGGNYDETSAVLCSILHLMGIIMGILIWAYNRFLVKRWS